MPSLRTRPIICLFILALLSLPTGATANPPSGDLVLGLYTVPDYTGQEYIDGPGPFGFTAYLCLTGASGLGQITGFDCKLDIPRDHMLISEVRFPLWALNFGDQSEGEFFVGYSSPGLDPGDFVILAEIDFVWLPFPSQDYLYLRPLQHEFVPVPGQITVSHCPSANPCPNEFIINTAMTPASGAASSPIFGISTGPLFPHTQRFSVDVTVVREEDPLTPVPGAEVSLLRWGDDVGTKYTDADGQCRFSLGSPATGEFYAAIARYGVHEASESLGHLSGISTYDTTIEIPSAMRIKGKLEDEHNFYALSRVSVEVYDTTNLLIPLWSGQTDYWGEFSFPFNSTGTYAFDIVVLGPVGSDPNARLYKNVTTAPVDISSEEFDVDLGTLRLETNVVALVHGIFGSSEDWEAIEYPQRLRERGWTVLDGIDLPGETPIASSHYGLASIVEQARFLQRLIDNTGARSVHIIAHSQGGLVSRYLNENRSGQRGMVSKLVMLATPHHGSPLANILKAKADWIGGTLKPYFPDWLNYAIDELITAIERDVPASVQLQPNSGFLKLLNQRALGEHIVDWSGKCSSDPNVELALKPRTDYLTIRGRDIGSTLLEWQAFALMMGNSEWRCLRSDGIVPVESAQLYNSGVNVHNYRAADIGSEVHHKSPTARIFKDAVIRDWVFDRLEEDASAWPPESTSSKQALAVASNTWNSLGYRSLHVGPALVASDSFYVDVCDTLDISWSWSDGHVDLVLEDPMGTVIDSLFAQGTPGVIRELDPAGGAGRFLIADPASGSWQIQATSSGSSLMQSVYVFAAASGAVAMQIDVTRMDETPFAPRVVVASLEDAFGGAITGATIEAEATGPSGGSVVVSFLDDGIAPDTTAGDGNYSTSLSPEPSLGTTIIEVQATGSAPGTFERSTIVTIQEHAILDVSVVDQELTASSMSYRALSPVDLSASIQNSGAFAAEVEVLFVLENTGAVIESTVAVIDAGQTIEVTASHLPNEPGLFDYRLELVPEPGFLDAELSNNFATISVLIGGHVTGIREEDDPDHRDIPMPPGKQGAAILSAYPNPFNPVVKLSLTHETSGTVQVRIYDARGRLVRRLYSGHRERGAFQLEWRGTTDSGQRVASGVYFVHFESSGTEDVRKLALVE